MSEDNASSHEEFNSLVCVSWPSAGGYPSSDKVIEDLEKNRDTLQSVLEEQLFHGTGSSDYDQKRISVDVEHFGVNGNTGVILWLSVRALDPLKFTTSEAIPILRRLKGTIWRFFVRNQGGANAYTVKMKWGWGKERRGQNDLPDETPPRTQGAAIGRAADAEESEINPGFGQGDGASPPPPGEDDGPSRPRNNDDPYSEQKVSIYLSLESQSVLQILSNKQGTTATEIIRRGIGLMQFFDTELKQGDRLLIDTNSGKVRRMVLPWES
jgi:hypothetical protein